MDKALLDIICCPVSLVPLQLMPESRLHRLNELIGARQIKNREGALLDTPLEEALMTRNAEVAYPIRDGIPVLLEEEGILLAQLDASAAAD